MVKRYLNIEDIERATMKLFDREKQARTGALIIQGILEVGSPRISAISHAIEGRQFDANYKVI